MKNILLHIGFLSLWLNSVAQKPMVLLDVDPKDAQAGEILTITVKSNVQGDLDIDFPSGFVHGYNVMNGMEQEMDYNTGKVITYYYMSQTGAMNKEGSFTFGPAYIKKGNKVYRSNTVSVTIKKSNSTVSSGENISSKQLRQPAFGIIERSRTTIYEGEPVVVNARIYSRFNPSHLENYSPYSVSGAIDKHEIGKSSRIYVEETKIKNTNLYTFVYDKNVIFPTGTGRIEIDPFKLLLQKNYESVPVTSSSAFIEVKPLPAAPKDFAGGVGQFKITREIAQKTLNQGDIFSVIIVVSGTGNLHNLLEPKQFLPKGFNVYGDPIVKEEFSFGPKGAEGKITYEYNIQVTLHGNLTLPGTSYSYFDPQKEKYVQVISEGSELVVAKDIHFKPKSSENTTEGQPEAADEITSLRSNEGNVSTNLFFGTPLFWLGIGSPFALALLFGFITRKQEKKRPEIETIEKRKSIEKTANDFLDNARESFKSGEYATYFSLIEKAIIRSLSHHLQKEESVVLSKSEIIQGLSDEGKNHHDIYQLTSILEKCEFARFGLGEVEKEDMTEDVRKLLSSLQKK